MEAEHSPTAGTFVEPQIMHNTVVPDTFLSPTSNSTHDQPSSGAFEVEHHTRPSTNSCPSSLASGESNNQHFEPSVPVEDQCHNQIFPSSPLVKNEMEATPSQGLTPSIPAANIVDIVDSGFAQHAIRAYDELQQQRQYPDHSLQATPSTHKETCPWRSSEDGYNWRKYGQKHIKGSEFPRSYYKCSFPNCHVKKQVERSLNGHITEVIYKGQHDHPKSQISSQMLAGTVLPSIQEERSNVYLSNNREEKLSNDSGQTSPQPKQNGVAEPPLVSSRDDNVEAADEKFMRLRDAVQNNDDDPEFKRRRLKLNTDTSELSKDQQGLPSVQEDEGHCQDIISSGSIANVDAGVSSNELTLSVPVRNPSMDMVTSGAIVPFGVDFDALGKRSNSGLQAMRSAQKGTSRFVTSERLWGDGYNWRKYGQKHIKGSEFPRSYYRCTHPNCQVKKQLERSHGGQITEVIYKGEHDHPKPQPNSHMPVGRFLSIQEEGSDRFSSLSCIEDKASNGHLQLAHCSVLNGASEPSPIATSDINVLAEGSRCNRTDDMVERHDDKESKWRCLKFNNEISPDAAAYSNHKQCEASGEVGGQCQSQTLVSSPSTKNKTRGASSHELTPSVTTSNPPVYTVTSRGIVPVKVESDELRQRQGSDCGAQATQSDYNGISMAMTERLLENAYHWRKYGQKNIKGNESPRSYYRCTYPNCQVKMQLERSRDGQTSNIIYKGKHDHPKPQPVSRMAIGAILSLDEDISDRFSMNSAEAGTQEKSSNGHAETSLHSYPVSTPERSIITPSDDDVECSGGKSNSTHDEVENENDLEIKLRKKDTDDADFTPVRAPKEPRIVVETLSDFDVVDDGYRWQKYGRKMVKGNPNPRNYYRCSNAACTVKKHVERASNNPKSLITTYEGKHNHDLPPPRTIGQDTIQKCDSSDMFVNRCEETDTACPDVGNATSSGLDDRLSEYEEIMDIEPLQSNFGGIDSDCSKVNDRMIVI